MIFFDNPISDDDCEDVDECVETDPALVHSCDPNATCQNTGQDSRTNDAGIEGRGQTLEWNTRYWSVFVNSWEQQEVLHVAVMLVLPTIKMVMASVIQMGDSVGRL